jgi:P4 family phage/plasmid primase-like protien
MLAQLYEWLGPRAILLPIPFGKKGPVFDGWQTTTFERTQEPDYQESLTAAIERKGNIGVLLTGGLVSVDVDDDAFIDAFAVNAPFKDTLRSRGRRGCNFWFRMIGEYPNGKNVYKLKSDGKTIGECRCGPGAQTVIWGEHELSTHENPIRYKRLVPAPAVEVPFQELPWPEGVALPWEKKQPQPKQSNKHATNLEKRIQAYVAAIPGAVEGQDGSGKTYYVACQLVNGFALSASDALRYLQAYNQRCQPPWTDKELEHKLADAEKADDHDNPRGHLRDAEGSSQGSSETELAEYLQSQIPPLRCIAEDWFIYQSGVWRTTSRHEFKPLALSIQDRESRTSKKAVEILKHVEFANQINGKEFRSFYFQNSKGDEIVLNCANCVLSVSANEVRIGPHSERYMFTRQIAANYRPEAEASAFEEALQAALPDSEDIKLFRSFCGYILMPDCRHEAALICYGDSGTGKSTLSTGVEAALGKELVSTFSLAQVSNPENKNLAKLANCALNLSTELNAIEVGGENFKLLVSGEAIDADRKYKDSITLRTPAKHWFNANHLPKFTSGTDAEIRRSKFLRFAHKVEQTDVTLKDRIKTESDGVLLFMLEGLRVVLQEGTLPNGGAWSDQTRERFKVQNDPISQFVETECVLDSTLEIIKTQLHNGFCEFCHAHGIPPYSENSFYRELYSRYLSLKTVRPRSDSGRIQVVKGIDLRED